MVLLMELLLRLLIFHRLFLYLQFNQVEKLLLAARYSLPDLILMDHLILLLVLVVGQEVAEGNQYSALHCKLMEKFLSVVVSTSTAQTILHVQIVMEPTIIHLFKVPAL